MANLTDAQIATVAYNAGFRQNGLVMSIAICLAESGGNPDAKNTAGNSPPSTDRGLWQINSYWHKEVSDSCAFSPPCAAGQAYNISSKGTNWTPWSTYGNGAYKQFMQRATAAAQKAGPSGPNQPLPPAPPPPSYSGGAPSQSGYLGLSFVVGNQDTSTDPKFVQLGSDRSQAAVFGPLQWIIAWAVMGGALFALGKTRWGYAAMYYGEALILLFLFATQYQFFKQALLPFTGALAQHRPASMQGNTEFKTLGDNAVAATTGQGLGPLPPALQTTPQQPTQGTF